jgi:hypothetical protein
MEQCEGVGWLLGWFALMTQIYDIRERNVTITSDIWTTYISSLGFRDIREWVTLWRLILRSVGCTIACSMDCIHKLQLIERRPHGTLTLLGVHSCPTWKLNIFWQHWRWIDKHFTKLRSLVL